MWERTSSPERGSERLATRRRNRRRRIRIALGVLVLLILGGCLYGLQQSAVRISTVEVHGADASLAQYATDAMQGKYAGLIPRDSIFFYPASSIRRAILADHAGIAALSFSTTGLRSIAITATTRAPLARWCGLAPTSGVEEYCYVFDASGYIFAPYASSTETINAFRVYAPLVDDTLEPLRATLSHIEALPATFDFARQLDTLGTLVTHLVFRNDEVDTYLTSGTRITYVIGSEQQAFTALTSAKENMNLSDGSIEYVDLRFDGKVYLKRN